MTLSVLDRFQNLFSTAKSGAFLTKVILGYTPYLKYVAALLWKT